MGRPGTGSRPAPSPVAGSRTTWSRARVRTACRPPTTMSSPTSATWPIRDSPSTPPTGWSPGWTRKGWLPCRKHWPGRSRSSLSRRRPPAPPRCAKTSRVTWPDTRAELSESGCLPPAKYWGSSSSTAAAVAAATPGHTAAYRDLDVTILQKLIFERVLGIPSEGPAAEKNVTFFKDAGDAFERLENGEFQAGFFMNPTGLEQVRDVAFAGERMPQKATFFYPKLPTGSSDLP